MRNATDEERKPMKKICVLGVAVSLALASVVIPTLAAETRVIAQKKPDLSLRYEVEHALDKGLNWLIEKQNPDGSWSQAEYPALTALVLKAFMGEPSGKYLATKPEFVERGYRYLLGNVQADGGIYSKAVDQPLESYNTAIGMMALLLAREPAFEPTIKRARNYLVSLQNDGGIGYNKSGHSDMSNTVIALEALYYSKYLEADGSRGDLEPARKLDWAAALRFISRSQNLPGSNPEKWASDDPANRGGFVYFPGDSKAGEEKLADGRTALRSYGSMSYAGLLSYVYADLAKDDPRVTAVYDWLRKNYTLSENPGMGAQGLFYYYHTMAKALSAYGVERIALDDGREVDWRKELALKLLSLQNGEEGFWINENGRWWERDPVLVTAYALVSLEILHRGI